MSGKGGIGEARGRRLDSWKAIAQFLDHDIRSVQRWEQERGLPVHRLPGQKGGTVFAYEHELERWLHSGAAAPATPDFAAASEDAASSGARGTTAVFGAWGAVAGAVLLAGAIALVLGISRKPTETQPPPARVAGPALAVLPMQNLSAEVGQEYFADGFTDELTTELAQIRSLRVISRTSTMVFKGSKKPLPEIARALHANYILEGSITREAGHVRVRAQLIDTATDTHVSARTYDSDLGGVLDIESQIARAIASDVSLALSPQEKSRLASVPVVDPQAHDLYLRASYAFAQQSPESIRQSLALYKAAVARSPGFARAYLGIAQAEAAMLQITAEDPNEATRNERNALAKALAIDPHLGDARGLLASITYWHDRNWPLAAREFREALADGAQAPTEQRYGAVLDTRGLLQDGMAHIQRAVELDPLGKAPRVSELIALELQGKFAQGRREAEALLASSPNFLAGHYTLASFALDEHDCDEADAQVRWIATHYPSPMGKFLAAGVSVCRGNMASARNALDEAASAKGVAYASPYQLALGYSAVRDRLAALSYLEKSAAMNEPQIMGMKVDPSFAWLRGDPRFVALEKRLGFPP